MRNVRLCIAVLSLATLGLAAQALAQGAPPAAPPAGSSSGATPPTAPPSSSAPVAPTPEPSVAPPPEPSASAPPPPPPPTTPQVITVDFPPEVATEFQKFKEEELKDGVVHIEVDIEVDENGKVSVKMRQGAGGQQVPENELWPVLEKEGMTASALEAAIARKPLRRLTQDGKPVRVHMHFTFPIPVNKIVKPKPPASTFAIEALGGLGGRLDHTDSGYSDDSRGGLLLGGGLFFAPSRLLAVGLSYQRQVGAWEEYSPGPTFVSTKVNRTYQSILANLRLYPIRSNVVGLWGGLLLGATLQTASATGTEVPANYPVVTPSVYNEDAGPKAGMALGLAVGVDYDIGKDFAALASLNLMNHWMTSDTLNSGDPHPIAGAGTATMLDFRVALQYRFDTSRAAIPASGTVKTGRR